MRQDIYKFILNKLKIRFIIVTAMLTLTILSYYFETESVVILDKYKNDFSALEASKDKMNTLVERIEHSVVIWENNLKSLYQDRRGLDIEVAKKKIYEFKKIYGFKNFSINITDPTTNQNFANLNYVDLKSSILNINFKSLSDVDVVHFIGDLKNELPGIVNDIYLDMRLQDDTSLNVKVVMVWQNFQDKGEDE